jgi:3-hydroxyisobutyrate dehydrogenase-like beta-hydroxyacid dehydrogenase
VAPKAASKSVAFLGIGNMGKPMATRLAQAGVPLVVWSRDRSKADGIKKHGALVAKSPADCVQNAHIIVLMLSDPDAVREVLEGSEGVLAGLERGAAARKSRAVVVDMATTGRALARETAAKVEKHRAQYLDAPVSGSVGPAARGELVALVGGDPRALGKADEILKIMCKKVIHAGPIGAGQALKTVLNGVGAHHFVAFASMLALGERAGLDRAVVVDAFTSGAFATPSYIGKKAKVLARDYTPEFSLALALKDSALVVALMHELGLKLPVFKAIVGELEAGVREGLGEDDLFGIERHYAPPK